MGNPDSPVLDYLAKDYESFRKLMLDRLATTMPQWRERHVADFGVTLVEAIAHMGDRLSYMQDAVAMEAYLRTARRRISVRRHASLLDYRLHEGCNARAWVNVEVAAGVESVVLVQNRTWFAAELRGAAAGPVERTGRGSPAGEIFRLVKDRQTIHSELNRLEIVGHLSPGDTSTEVKLATPEALRKGDAVIFEIRAGGVHFHPVMLIEDAKSTTAGSRIIWGTDDAVPQVAAGATSTHVLGNVVLVDHGQWVEQHSMPLVRHSHFLTATLDATNVTHIPVARKGIVASAKTATTSEPVDGLPQIRIFEERGRGRALFREWRQRPTLLDSEGWDAHFCVEFDNSGRPVIRFGDGGNGAAPEENSNFWAQYRVGNGPKGHVPAGSITQIYDEEGHPVGGIGAVFNPLPAQGGREREAMDVAQLLAPDALVLSQRRAVTVEDYEDLVSRVAGVRMVSARTLRDATRVVVEIAVLPVDAGKWQDLKARILNELEPVRRINHEPVVVLPRRVNVTIALEVNVVSAHNPSQVKANVEAAIRSLFDGKDGLRIGQPLQWSQLMAVCMRVAGVANVRRGAFSREAAGGAAGSITAGPLELLQLAPDGLTVEV